jgi:hypothetical protein
MPNERVHRPVVGVAIAGNKRSFWRRRIAIATAIVFFASSMFPLAAGLSHDAANFPSWWGPLDVGTAAVLAVLTLLLFAVGQGRITKRDEEVSYRGYRMLIHAVFAALVALLIFGDRIAWSNCLPGFAWRYWLLLYSLPTWYAAFGVKE